MHTGNADACTTTLQHSIAPDSCPKCKETAFPASTNLPSHTSTHHDPACQRLPTPSSSPTPPAIQPPSTAPGLSPTHSCATAPPMRQRYTGCTTTRPKATSHTAASSPNRKQRLLRPATAPLTLVPQPCRYATGTQGPPQHACKPAQLQPPGPSPLQVGCTHALWWGTAPVPTP